MGGSGLLFVDFDLHMNMQINIVVPTQNTTKNDAEKLGRKVKAPTWGLLPEIWVSVLLLAVFLAVCMDLGLA
jgi:hypothetical protein